ncbi:TetR/AcrR family transcriptional regulator [Pseudonocardia sp. CA-107938]|uniref:TetR/AcrR family transcriptional regulator n=1 Tax=Pseudonocardia sp. CA-107938 TaxID=3240021 RepID=UPI003D8F0F35
MNGRRAYAPRVPVEQRRTELLDAALDLVVTEGHSAATMEAVAERVGVSKPVVYGVFENRAALLGALLQREQEAVMAQLAAISPGRIDPGRPLGPQVAAVLDDVLAAARMAPQRWTCVVMSIPDMPAAFLAAREHTRAVLHARIEQHVRAWLAAAGIGPDVASDVVAHAVLSLVETAIRLVLTEPERYRPELITATLTALLTAGGAARD